jgi:hypothetical protein
VSAFIKGDLVRWRGGDAVVVASGAPDDFIMIRVSADNRLWRTPEHELQLAAPRPAGEPGPMFGLVIDTARRAG